MNRKRHIFPAFYFYPRPPRGGRRSRWSRGRGCRNFYPRPPRGGRRPELQCCCTKRRIFLSTPSARRATLCLVVTFHFRDISIHALREEGDTLQSKSTERLFDFYPRPPRGGRRAQHGRLSTRRRTFLSTPSARRATSAGQQVPPESQYFYPRPPRGGRLYFLGGKTREYDFYPRPPRGGRPVMRRAYDEKYRFLSTPSARRATAWSFATRSPTIISIHALREEGDLSPCAALLLRLEFLSTPSARRATTRPPRPRRWHSISIHALREEGDPDAPRLTEMRKLFLSTPSARRATHPPVGGGDVEGISIHALREEGDVRKGRKMQWYGSFLSTPSARRAT